MKPQINNNSTISDIKFYDDKIVLVYGDGDKIPVSKDGFNMSFDIISALTKEELKKDYGFLIFT